MVANLGPAPNEHHADHLIAGGPGMVGFLLVPIKAVHRLEKTPTWLIAFDPNKTKRVVLACHDLLSQNLRKDLGPPAKLTQ